MLRTLAVVFLLAQAGAPQTSPRDVMLITPAQLSARLTDPRLVLLHVGDKPGYDAAHIPGARFVSLRDLATTSDNLVLQVPDAAGLRSQLEALGISGDSRIVVYVGKDGFSHLTRVFFTLAHAGLDRVSLLDGGMPAWERAGHAVTAVVPAARTGSLAALRPRDDIADAAFVQANLGKPGFVLIDSRDPVFYQGTQAGGPRDRPTAGHITGAVSVPYRSVTAADMTLKPRAELEAIFAQAGVKPGDTLVTYCHIGQQATAVLFAARTLGYTVKLYDGSFEDWVRRGLPVTNPR